MRAFITRCDFVSSLLLQAFRKLHRIVPKSVTVIYQIANLFEMLNDHGSAAEWFKILHGYVLAFRIASFCIFQRL